VGDHFLDAHRERLLIRTNQLIKISYNQLMNFPGIAPSTVELGKEALPALSH